MAKHKILVVEDEFIVAFELRFLLEDLGYAVCGVASSGDEAIEFAERERPEIVLMDVSIKGDRDGIEAARRIRSRFGIPTAFLTGYPAERVLEKARDVEPVGVLMKPLRCQDLEAVLKEFLLRADSP